jgi:putative flavoprotein involved in K+ transport
MTAQGEGAKNSTADDTTLDVVVVGGSQAGLAMAWHLAQQGLRFVVLEAQYSALPGMPFPAPADTYPTKDPVADYLQAYAADLDLPVRLKSSDRAATGRGHIRGPHHQPDTFRPPGGGRHRPVPGPLHPTSGQQAGPVGDSGPQRRLPQHPSPAGRPGAGGGRRQLGVPDRRGTGRHPPGRPVDRRQGPDAAAAAAGQGPVLVAHPPRRHAGVSVNSRVGRRASKREFIIGTSRRTLTRAGVRFRPRLADAHGRTVWFGDHSTLEDVGVVVWATGYRLPGRPHRRPPPSCHVGQRRHHPATVKLSR